MRKHTQADAKADKRYADQFKVFSIRVPRECVALLGEMAQLQSTTMTQLIRELVAKEIKSYREGNL